MYRLRYKGTDRYYCGVIHKNGEQLVLNAEHQFVVFKTKEAAIIEMEERGIQEKVEVEYADKDKIIGWF